ncbi:dethiobiotin synthase [bacterium]|nr:dethiobiotin synthase [bacterium]
MLNLYVTSIEESNEKQIIITGLASIMQSLGYSVCVYKPVQIDGYFDDGKLFSKEFDYITKTDEFIDIKCSYLFENSSNPLIASAKSGRLIDRKQIREDFLSLTDKYDCLISGGIFGPGTPLNVDYLEFDMMKDLNLPALFLVSAGKNSMSNILSTLKKCEDAQIPIRGVIIHDYPDSTEDENIRLMPRLIEEYTGARVLGILGTLDKNTPPQELIELILNSVDVEAVFDVEIEKLEK